MKETEEVERRPVARNAISWADGAIQREAEKLMPDTEMHGAYIWLKTHVREECQRSIPKFMDECTSFGISTDETNYIRILKGQWQWDSQGNLQPAPCIARDRFLMEVRSLRERVNVEFLRGRLPFFETSVYKTIKLLVTKARRKDWVNKFVVIVGATGTQKTASFKQLCLKDKTIKHVEASDSGRFSEFITEVAAVFGERRSVSQTRKKIKIYEAVTDETCIIVDNTQDLAKLVKDSTLLDKQQPAFSFMRRLQDNSGCTIIWSITPDDESILFGQNLGYMEQFIGRIGGRENIEKLPDFPPSDDLVVIAEGMGMLDAQQHRAELTMLGSRPGRIRPFFGWIQEGKSEADFAAEKFSWSHVAAKLAERGVNLTPAPVSKKKG